MRSFANKCFRNNDEQKWNISDVCATTEARTANAGKWPRLILLLQKPGGKIGEDSHACPPTHTHTHTSLRRMKTPCFYGFNAELRTFRTRQVIELFRWVFWLVWLFMWTVGMVSADKKSTVDMCVSESILTCRISKRCTQVFCFPRRAPTSSTFACIPHNSVAL